MKTELYVKLSVNATNGVGVMHIDESSVVRWASLSHSLTINEQAEVVRALTEYTNLNKRKRKICLLD